MKILILSFYYPPDLCAGSFRTGALVDALLNHLPDDAHIEVMTTLPNRYQSFNKEAPEYEESDRLTIQRIRLPNHKSGMWDQARAFIHFAQQALRRTKNKPYQLIYGTSSRLMTAALSARIASQHKIPLYLDIRDIFADTIKDVLPAKAAFFVKPAFDLIERWTINKAQHVNLVSAGFRDYFVSRYPKQRFSYFTNGIDEEFINLSQNKPPKKHDDEIRTILYAGNIGEGQGLHKILPELALMLGETTKFRVIGDGGRKKPLQQALVEQGISNIELLDPVNRAELIKAYQQADILFLHLNNYPAFAKVLPSKIFEYAALGKPILAGVPGYAAQFIRAEVINAAVFAPCDAQQAKQAIASLTLADTNRHEFVEKFARANIMRNMAQAILSVYDKCR